MRLLIREGILCPSNQPKGGMRVRAKMKDRAGLIFLPCLTLVALYFCYLLIAPFLRPILFSTVLAILAYPLHLRVLRRIRNRNVSGLLTTA